MKVLYLLLVSLTLVSCNTTSKEPTSTARNDNSLNFKIQGSIKSELEVLDAKVNLMGFFVAPRFYGAINDDSTFEIDFPAEFIDTTAAAIQQYNTSDGAVYELSGTTLSDYFTSNYTIESSGLQQPAALAGKYYSFNTSSNQVLLPYSSSSFFKTIVDGQNNETGYYYYFLYSNGPFKLKGIEVETYESSNATMLEQKTEYDIVGEKGWNILKYEVAATAVFDQDARMATSIKHTSVPSIPLDFRWILIDSQ
ncbi:MAG: hypothetical protein WBA16_11980 [Nonlabens sp.]